MVKQLKQMAPAVVWAVCAAAALLDACVGSGDGLDANGNPLGASSAPSSAGLTADFESIQDTVFTPICTRCHSGAGAPEGLQLDAAHSYALLVGVPSAEVPGTLRVKPGDPADSYLIQKLQGSSGIVGAQMPFGGPYLPQATIDVIRQWITAGAAAATTSTGTQSFEVTATAPVDRARIEPTATIAMALSEEPDPSQLQRSVLMQNVDGEPSDVPVRVAQADGNPSTVLVTPAAPLAPGSYRITLRGGRAGAVSASGGQPLAGDYSFSFTVGTP